MKVTPVASPAAVQQVSSNEALAKARAVAAFAQASSPVPQNQNAVSPEETVNTQSQDSGTTEEQAPVEETKVAAPAEQDPELRKQFLQLARHEKQLRAKAQQAQQQLQERENAIAAREAAIEAQSQKYQTGYVSQERIKQDLLSVAAEAGLSYDEVAQQLLNQPSRDPRTEAMIAKLEAKIQSLEAANEGAKKSQSESQAQAYQAAVKQIQMDVNQLVKSDPNFETIAKTGSSKEVTKLIERTFQEEGILLSVEEAAQEVEDFLVEKYTKISNIDKIKQRMSQANAKQTTQASSQTQAGSPKAQQTQQPPQMKTLTNAASSTRQLSARERALLAFKGELKS